MTLQDFLVWLAAGGGSVALLSWIAERVAWFQTLTSENRKYAMIAGSVVIAIVAKLLLDFVPQTAIDIAAPYFGVAYGVILIYLQNQVAHRIDTQAK